MSTNENMNDYLENIFENISDVEMQFEELLFEISEEINRVMTDQGISKSEMALKMGVSKPYVTKLLRGSNMSLQTLAKVSIALEHKFHVSLRPKGWECFTFAVSPQNGRRGRRERYEGFKEQGEMAYAAAEGY